MSLKSVTFISDFSCHLSQLFLIPSNSFFQKFWNELSYINPCLYVLVSICPFSKLSFIVILVKLRKQAKVNTYVCAVMFIWNSLFFPFFLEGCTMACEILVPESGIKPILMQCKCRVLTTGPPGKSLKQYLSFYNIIQHVLKFLLFYFEIF